MLDAIVVDAFIEIPKYSQNKYEFDPGLGRFRLDRVLYSPIHYPTDYGFVPDTIAEDDDPLDIMVMTSAPTFPGCVVTARLIGALEMSDEKGRDIKLLSVSVRDPRYHEVNSLTDVPPHVVKEIEYFFQIYKELEGIKTVVGGWQGREFAAEVLEASRRAACSPGGPR